VTGGAGFTGRRVVTALAELGHDVTVADLREVHAEGVRSVVGDLCDPSVAVRAVASGTDVIIHLAAVTSVLRSIEDPAGTHALNVDVTAHLLELARNQGVKNFILASSNAVTGDVGRAVITEQITPRPLILGAGESITVNDILTAARSVTGAPIPAEHIPPRQGEMPAVIVDISAARALGYHPTHDLKSGIATVWPEWAPCAQGQAAADGKAAQ
jgi:UDP-glucose 4-epimerase